MKLAGKQVKAEVAKEHLNSAPLDFAAVAKAAQAANHAHPSPNPSPSPNSSPSPNPNPNPNPGQAAADAANAKRAREVAAGKRLAAEGELCDGMGRFGLELG